MKIFNKIKKSLYLINTFGLSWFVSTLIYTRLFKLFPIKIRHYVLFLGNLKGKSGIEIGGPSPLFEKKSFLPIYNIIGHLDICNLKKISDSVKYVCDATDLHDIELQKYDFVLSSHTLEHIANPLKALSEWLRIIKENGIVLIVLPHKNRSIDHKRPVTTLAHLIDDYKNGIKENDETHLREVLELVDVKVERGVSDNEDLKKMVQANYGGVHLHVFDPNLVIKIFDHFNLQIIALEETLPYNIVALGKKLPKGIKCNNSEFARKVNKGLFASRDKKERMKG